MAFCTKCGANIAEDAKFCPTCGCENPIGNAQNTQAQNQAGTAQQAFSKFTDTADYTSTVDAQDIAQNKIFAILAYIGILVLVPIFAAPKSKFARFHANQGLVLAIAEIALSILNAIISTILNVIFLSSYSSLMWGIYGIISTIIGLVFAAAGILLFVLAIMGIVNAATGKAKEVPLVGKIKILK